VLIVARLRVMVARLLLVVAVVVVVRRRMAVVSRSSVAMRPSRARVRD
jgi:hypothetical protein